MQKLPFQISKDRSLQILCLGAHSDDIEIGCGGTMLRLKEEYKDIDVTWVVFSAKGEREIEAQESADAFLSGIRQRSIRLLKFRDGYYPYQGPEIKDYFEELKKGAVPDVIFTHYRHDLHQDHRVICDLTWNTFRDHLILEYEIPKYDGDIGNPNFFVGLERQLCEKKIQYLLENFKSQTKRQWFDYETFFALLRLRGMEANSASRYAEAFYNRKLLY